MVGGVLRWWWGSVACVLESDLSLMQRTRGGPGPVLAAHLDRSPVDVVGHDKRGRARGLRVARLDDKRARSARHHRGAALKRHVEWLAALALHKGRWRHGRGRRVRVDRRAERRAGPLVLRRTPRRARKQHRYAIPRERVPLITLRRPDPHAFKS